MARPRTDSKDTVWVLGDQLNTEFSALAAANPLTHRVLMVESRAKLSSKRWHIQRAHFVVASMRRFARELESSGWEVDYRHADTLASGLRQHRDEYNPGTVFVMEPASWSGLRLVEREECNIVRGNQFLCHYDEFTRWCDEWLQIGRAHV